MAHTMEQLSPDKATRTLPNISAPQPKLETCSDEIEGIDRTRGNDGGEWTRRPGTAPVAVMRRRSSDDESAVHDDDSAKPSDDQKTTQESLRLRAKRLLMKSAKCRKRTSEVCKQIEKDARDKKSAEYFGSISKSKQMRPSTTTGSPRRFLSSTSLLTPLDLSSIMMMDDAKVKPQTRQSIGTMFKRDEERKKHREAELQKARVLADEARQREKKETIERENHDRALRQKQAEQALLNKQLQRQAVKDREIRRASGAAKLKHSAASIYGPSVLPKTARPSTHHGTRNKNRGDGKQMVLPPARSAKCRNRELGDNRQQLQRARSQLQSSITSAGNDTSRKAAEAAAAAEKQTRREAAEDAERAENELLEEMARAALAETRGLANDRLAAIEEKRHSAVLS